jgi:hypothetical protein
MIRSSLAGAIFAGILVFSCPAVSQIARLMPASATGLPGATVDLPINYAVASTPISDLQFNLTFPGSTIAYLTTDTTLAGKGIEYSYPIPGGVSVVIFGMDPSPISSGTVAVVHFEIRADSSPGIVPVRIGNLTGSDEYGNRVPLQGIDGYVEIRPTASTPLTISSALISKIAAHSATVTWTTNLPANSRVEYYAPPWYSSSLADSELVFTHSVTLSNLDPSTIYFTHLSSTTGSGLTATLDSGYFYTPVQNDTAPLLGRWYCPWISSQGLGLPGEEHIGLAVANPDTSPVNIAFTALANDGSTIVLPGFNNPAFRQLQAGQKLAVLDSELFGMPVLPGATGSIKIESASPKPAGFFVTYDNALTRLDGADFSSLPLTSFLIPEIDTRGFTRIKLVNPNAVAANVSLSLINAHGEVRCAILRSVPPGGTIAMDMDRSAFPVAPESSDYVRAVSDLGVLPVEMFRGASGDFSVLNALDANTGATKLYSPQFVFDNDWRSSLSIINQDPIPGIITIDLIDEFGVKGAEVRMVLDSKGKVRIDDTTIFGLSSFRGYLQITSNGIRLAGSAVFGAGDAATALPLVSRLQDSVLFSHIASDDVYYTGIAILNPGATDAAATLVLYNENGGIDATVKESVPARQRISKLLTDFFPSLAGQNRRAGYVRLIIDHSVASYAVYGTKNLSILCAIPGQIIAR